MVFLRDLLQHLRDKLAKRLTLSGRHGADAAKRQLRALGAKRPDGVDDERLFVRRGLGEDCDERLPRSGGVLRLGRCHAAGQSGTQQEYESPCFQG